MVKAKSKWDATRLSLGLAVAVSVLLCLLPRDVGVSPYQKAVKEDRFWALKVYGSEQVPIVAVGDSRTYRGLAPAALQSALNIGPAQNLGFSAAGFGPLLCNLADRRLTRSGPRVLLLGVSPRSLTSNAARNEQLNGLLKMSKAEALSRVYLTPLYLFFRPLALDGDSGPIFDDFRDDGWDSVCRDDIEPDYALSEYVDQFKRYKVSAQVEAFLMEQVKRWVSQGVKVFGYRPPVSKSMRELEGRESGFDEGQFRAMFAASGGRWLDVPTEGWTSYDGSHLECRSAIRLSRLLGEMMRTAH